MKLTPDIEDIQDVVRFCVDCWYPMQRDAYGVVTKVGYIRTVIGDKVMLRSWTRGMEKYKDEALSLDDFLDLEQGYYKPRMVEYEGSVMYIRNLGANEHSRNHGVNLGRIRFDHIHEQVTNVIHNFDGSVISGSVLSKKRTPYHTALQQLSEGDIIGCALSDNYGLATFHNKEHIQVMRRTRIIGEVVKDRPQLHPHCEQYTLGVGKACRL